MIFTKFVLPILVSALSFNALAADTVVGAPVKVKRVLDLPIDDCLKNSTSYQLTNETYFECYNTAATAVSQTNEIVLENSLPKQASLVTTSAGDIRASSNAAYGLHLYGSFKTQAQFETAVREIASKQQIEMILIK